MPDVFSRVDRKLELSERVLVASSCVLEFVNNVHCPAGSEKGGEFAPKDGDCGGGGHVPGAELPEGHNSGMGIPQPPFASEDFSSKGKPNPGTDAWLHAHGIDRVAFEDRPYYRFEQGDTFDDLPASIQKLYEGEPEATRQLNKIMKQEPGYIMVRHAVDDSPIVPQTRPDAPIVTNPGKHAFKKAVYNNSVKRAEEMRALTPETVVELQRGRVERAHTALETAKTIDKVGFLKPAVDRVSAANDALAEAKQTGDGEAIADATKKVGQAKNALKGLQKNADHAFGPDGQSPEEEAAKLETYRSVATANAEKQIKNSEKKLAKYEADPAAAIDNEIKNADAIVVSAKASFDKTSVKYVFPPNPSKLKSAIEKGEILGKAGRVNAHEEENLKRLKEGHGRVYLAMEGNIKEDSLLSAIRGEGDKDACVISVPSVTLWRNKEMGMIAEKYLQGREVVLIPDADGVNNPRVQNEARAMQSFLESKGAHVIVAPPPIPLDAKGKPIPDPDHHGDLMMFENTITGSPTGAIEKLKGADDYLGLGKGTGAKGTLGNLAMQNREAPAALKNIDLVGVVDALAVPKAEKTMQALSNIIGPVGSGRVGSRMISAAIGNFYDHNTNKTLGYLSKAVDPSDGQPLVKIEQIFDPIELARGHRVMHPDMTEERITELVKMHVIDRPSFGEDDTRPIEFGYEETPIITIHPKYRSTDSVPTPLESISRPKGFKANRTARIKNLAGSGKTNSEIAKLLKISESAVSEAING